MLPRLRVWEQFLNFSGSLWSTQPSEGTGRNGLTWWKKQPHLALAAVQGTPDTHNTQRLWGLYPELQQYEELCPEDHASPGVVVWSVQPHPHLEGSPPNCSDQHTTTQSTVLPKPPPCPCSQGPSSQHGMAGKPLTYQVSLAGMEERPHWGRQAGAPALPCTRAQRFLVAAPDAFHQADLAGPLKQSHRLCVLTESPIPSTKEQATGASGAWPLLGHLQGRSWQLKAIHWDMLDLGTAQHSIVHNPTIEPRAHRGGNPLPDPPRATKINTAICFLVELFNKLDVGNWALIFSNNFIWISLNSFFFCFWPHPWHGEIPGPGIEPMPQQLPEQQSWQCQILIH